MHRDTGLTPTSQHQRAAPGCGTLRLGVSSAFCLLEHGILTRAGKIIAELNLDQSVRETVMKFPGEVVGIRFSISHDWNGDPAIFFRILLSDAASRQGILADITGRVAGELFDLLQLSESEYTPYFYFRSKAEQDKLKDPEWQ